MREMYKKEFGQFCPYFWDNSIVTDIRSHCVQLDITDLKGCVSTTIFLPVLILYETGRL